MARRLDPPIAGAYGCRMSSPQAKTVVLHLKPGRDKPVRGRHPWIFSGAIARLEGAPAPGDLALVQAAGGQALGWATVNERSQIVGRMLSWEPEATPGEAFWRGRLREAIALRAALPGLDLRAEDGACRLVNAESDGLPGLVIDRYGPYLVLQALTAGIDVRKAELACWTAELWAETTGGRCAGVYERSDVDVRAKEGLAESVGTLWGEAPPDLLWIREPLAPGGAQQGAYQTAAPDAASSDGSHSSHGTHETNRTYETPPSVTLPVDVPRGHKTGAYLDQTDNRRRVARYAAGRRVLNVFCYTGGFGLHAAAAGAASLTEVDSSAPALALAAAALARADLPIPAPELLEADAFQQLRRWRDEGRSFDLIVLDPPKFVMSAGQLAKAARAYKDINLLAMKLLAPGGILASFSCSGLVSAEFFLQILHGAALDAGRDLAILERLGQGADHPVRLSFPEGAYLKGILGRLA
jgi:23S rRNA (cytosine1962-C5)-methyltransferase